jgi:hypothetical protein
VRPQRTQRRLVVASVALLAALGLLGASGQVAAAAGGERTPFVQQHCPGTVAVYPPLGSPARSDAFYGVALANQIADGTLSIGNDIETTGLSATICGLLRFPQLTVSIPGVPCTPVTERTGCISFGVASTDIDGAVDLPTTFTAGPTEVAVDKTPAPNGGLALSITTEVTTHVHIARFGVDCSVGPITVRFTTGTSGPLTGAAVTGPLTLATAKIVGASFPIPGAAASSTCPSALLPATDRLVGLPAAAGIGRFTAPVVLANSLQ